MRTLMVRQLDIAWSFASECVIDRVTREAAVWEPSSNVVTVHETDEGWVAAWVDVELTKNLAGIHQLLVRRANR